MIDIKLLLILLDKYIKMKRYSVNEFKAGESVFHLSNPRLTMIVIGIIESSDEVICRWVDKLGKSNKESYLAVELAKSADKPSRVTILARPSHNHY